MRVAIIGASGEMGSFFARYFLEKGATVRAADPRAWKGNAAWADGLTWARTNSAAVAGSEVTILAVPMSRTAKVAKEIAHRLKAGSTLIEISSVKGGTNSALKRILGERVKLLSIHPLFGPALSSTKGMKIAVIVSKKSKGAEATEVTVAKKLFPEARIIPMGRKEHDRSMAVVLSLTHLLNLAYAGTVLQFLTPEEFMKVSTPNSSMQLTLAEAILSQDPSLSYAIQEENFYSRKVSRAASLELKRVMGMVKDADWEAFNEHVRRLAKRYGTDKRAGTVVREIYSQAEKRT